MRARRANSLRLAASVVVALAAVSIPKSWGLDPPHDATNSIQCLTCHTPHGALGTRITAVEGNANLCLTCHTPAGIASGRPFSLADQAFPGTGGTSHRWDSGPSGHVKPALSNTSPGRVRSGGAFTGRIEKSFTITITAAGEAGAATFSWTDGAGNGGSGTSGTGIPLADGLTLSFTNAGTAPSFRLGDRWTLFVRTDLRLPDLNNPAERAMAQRIMEEKVVCSTCHDQHSQQRTPFDPSAPPFQGPGTGAGRHFQRLDNDQVQMCVTCHSARNVATSAQGSHPVGVTIPASLGFQQPTALPLDPAGRVVCLTCHMPHYATSGGANGGQGDGYLLRLSIGDLCFQCHTLADRAAGSHFDPATGALWGGSGFGSSFPAHSADKRGACVNCHWPHGWPDDANLAQDYPKLWVERYDVSAGGGDPDDAEDLCYACHTAGAGASTNIRSEFLKGTNGTDIFHHPVRDSEQGVGRSVECVDCHNPHKARPDNKHAGVSGVDAAGNPVGEGTANPREVVQHEVCFKCHGDTFNAARSGTTNKRLDFQTGNSAYHPLLGAGRNQSANLANQLRGGLTTASTLVCTDCHNSEATANALGAASNSTARPKGPHGSTNAAIRRGNLVTALTGPASYSQNNFQLCFLCHDPARLVEARRFSNGASTNFYDSPGGKDNLHWVHLVDRADTARATCKNCHYNVHSNRTASNTQYNINGTVYTSPPPGFKTMLINFSPDIGPFGGRARPEWRLNTANRNRECYLSCHGTTMEGAGRGHTYRPDNGGDHTSFTNP